MATIINTPSTPTQITVNGNNVFIFPNVEDANNLWIKDSSGARPIGGSASLPYLELDNPGAAIVEGDIGKFAMPHPSTAGAAALYAWGNLPAINASLSVTINNAGTVAQAEATFTITSNPVPADQFDEYDDVGVTTLVTFENIISDADTQVLIGADTLETLQNLQAQLDTPTSAAHNYEIVDIVNIAGVIFSYKVRARAGGARDGITGNTYQVSPHNVAQQFLTGGQDASTLELRDDTGAVDHTITVGIEVAEGTDDAETVNNIANWINSNTSYTATDEGGGLLTIEYKAAGAAGNNADFAYTDSSGNVEIVSYQKGNDAYDAPTAPVLGKIVAVTDSTVRIDNLTLREYCTAVGEVNKQSILLASDGGEGVVDLYEINIVQSEEGTLYSVGLSQGAASEGESVLVVYGDPIAILQMNF